MTKFKHSWDEWLASPEGQNCSNALTMGGGAVYLENRLWRAFAAGWKAAHPGDSCKSCGCEVPKGASYCGECYI